MLDTWKVFKGFEASAMQYPIATGFSYDDAVELVDMCVEAGYKSYAVNPNGETYPKGLHDDGDFDPAFGD